jgi:competence protein ComEC
MQSNFSKFLLAVIVFCLFSLGVQFVEGKKDEQRAPLEVFFLDVGQGDAILVNYLGEYQLLIDGGASGDKLLGELDKVMPAGDKKIELMLLTHPDKDHLGGLIKALDNYEVELFLDNGQRAETKIVESLMAKVVEEGVRREAIFEGSEFSFGEHLNFRVFNPDELIEEDRDRNEQSIVVQMDFGNNSFLFTGDAEIESEEDLLQDQQLEDIDWLKVGHHGSSGSTGNEFLQMVRPEFAIISVGEGNRYGHPHEELLERLQKISTQVLRTDELGTIKVGCWGLEKECNAK